MCSVPGIGDIGSLLHLCSSGSGLVGSLNNICQPSLPQPEPANSGIDAIIKPPAGSGTGKTLYDNYGLAGQFWAATDMTCSDMTSLIGNNVAGMVFDAAKAVNRVTITVYQSAAGNGILSWLSNVVNRLISSLGNAIYFPYLAPVVLLGVMWLAWHGLIRKRATRTIEGTIWMVVACAAAIWLIGRPADFTGVGQSVSNGVTQVLNVAFSKLPNPGGGNCVPVKAGDPQNPTGGSFGFTQGNGLVNQNASELWSVLICKPWLDGEFGTTQFGTGRGGQTPVNTYGRQLLWAQAIAANETPTSALVKAKQSTYSGIAAAIKANNPAIYPLFQGNQWTSRLEIGFAALFAALVAGVLVLLIAITLIILKLGFLLLLIAGPFFLIIGTHPGFGRVVAMRWVEMIIGVLLKQVAVAIVLSVLLYAYSLIMGTTDSVLPWALKILMIALVTIAVFIYRKPFQHLFSAVGYGSIGARERAEIEIFRSREVLRRNALGTAAAAGGFAGYRVGRWSRRDPAQSAALAEHIALAAGSAAPGAAGQQAAGAGSLPNGHASADVNGKRDGTEADGQRAGVGVRAGAGGDGRAWAAAGTGGASRAAPPLHLPSRMARGRNDAQAAPSGWARSGVQGAGAGPQARAGEAPPRPTTPRTVRPGTAGPAVPGPAPRAFRTGGPLRAGTGTGAVRTGSGGGPLGPGGGPLRSGGGGPLGSGGGPLRSGGGGPLGSGGGPLRSGGGGPLGSGGGPLRSGGGGPLGSGGGPLGPGSGGGSSPRAASTGAARARWGSESAQGAGGGGRGRRPLWQPGPIRSSGGWLGGAGASPGPAPGSEASHAGAPAAPHPGGPRPSYPAGPPGYPTAGPASGDGPAARREAPATAAQACRAAAGMRPRTARPRSRSGSVRCVGRSSVHGFDVAPAAAGLRRYRGRARRPRLLPAAVGPLEPAPGETPAAPRGRGQLAALARGEPGPDRRLLDRVIAGEHLSVAALHRSAAGAGSQCGHPVLRVLRHVLLQRDRRRLHRPDARPDHQPARPGHRARLRHSRPGYAAQPAETGIRGQRDDRLAASVRALERHVRGQYQPEDHRN